MRGSLSAFKNLSAFKVQVKLEKLKKDDLFMAKLDLLYRCTFFPDNFYDVGFLKLDQFVLSYVMMDMLFNYSKIMPTNLWL